MPTLLAIESSTDACSVAICCGKVVQEIFVIKPREHNQILLPMIQELLHGLGLTFDDLDAIAFGAGPGSFTGLRLSAGIVQGLAFAAQKPVIPISCLAALAFSAGEHLNNDHPQNILVALDARMQDIYFGAYTFNRGTLLTLTEDQLLPASDLSKKTNSTDASKIGDGWPEHLLTDSNAILLRDIHPHARAVLALAKIQFEAGKVLSAEQALPVYLRETISWQKWQPKSEKTKHS